MISNKYEKKFLVGSIRRIVRDYQIVCENYVEAIKTAPLKKIEAIDVGRRTIHDDGAETLKDILSLILMSQWILQEDYLL